MNSVQSRIKNLVFSVQALSLGAFISISASAQGVEHRCPGQLRTRAVCKGDANDALTATSVWLICKDGQNNSSLLGGTADQAVDPRAETLPAVLVVREDGTESYTAKAEDANVTLDYKPAVVGLNATLKIAIGQDVLATNRYSCQAPPVAR